MGLAVRNLWRRPVFGLAAILTVALGIASNTALFGVIYSVLIQPLPFRDPGRLVQIWETHPALPQLQVTAPDFADWRAQSRSFQQISAYTLAAMNNTTLLGEGEPEKVHATMADSGLFSTIGIEPVVGRAFSEAEERGKEKVAVLSEDLWRRKFGGDAGVVGRQIRLAGDSFRVVGVAPRRQQFPAWADLWIPLSLMEGDLQTRRKYHPLEVIARLRTGVSVEQAQSEMRSIAARLAQDHAETNATVGAFVIPLAQQVNGWLRPPLLLAWAAVGLVLLMACANVAHLFLARIVERREEMAIRSALGASPWRLVRQVMGEGLMVAAIGGGLGMAAGWWGMQLARRFGIAAEFPPAVWMFAAGITLVAALLFGLPAAWQATRLRAAGRAVARGRSRMSAGLVAAEVALAFLVLAGVALLTRNFAALLDADPGFQAGGVWDVANLPLRDDWQKSGDFFAGQLAPAIRRVPGVVDVAAVNSAPMSLGATEHTRFATRFSLQGRTFEAGSYPVAQNRWVTPAFFGVLGIPLKSGRLLTASDDGKPVVVINETLARRFFGGRDAVGQQLILGVMDPKPQGNQIVGVVGDVRDFGLDQDVEPTFYGVGTSPTMTVLVKTAADSPRIAAALREAIHATDAEIAVGKIRPLARNVDDSLERRRLALTLLAIFGAMAALLTAAGVYGLLAQSVGARVREFGVRAAVGAAPRELVRMVLREAMVLALPGLAAGVALSLAFARVMRGFVYRLSPVDPLSMAGAAAFLLGLTVLSAWLPARRAAAVDVSTALRSE